MLYQWVRGSDQSSHQQPLPGKIDTAIAWPPSISADNKRPNKSSCSSSPASSPIKGESKIPKPLSSSTPSKAQIKVISNFITLNDPSAQIESPEKRKLNEIKAKIGKCENTVEIVQIFRNFLADYNMQSSESSSNSGIFSNSALNGSECTVYDRSMETTVFNILQQVPKTTTPPKQQTPPRKSPVKSRTTPNTPTGSSTKLASTSRRNLSVDSVNTSQPSNGRSASASPVKSSTTRRMVDKATVMDVEPLEMSKRPPEMISIEVQTDPIEIKQKTDNNADIKSVAMLTKVPAPPPPPPMMRKFFHFHFVLSSCFDVDSLTSSSSTSASSTLVGVIERSASTTR